MLLKVAAYLCPILGLIIIGLITLVKNTHDRLYVLFCGLALTMALWLWALFIGDLTINPLTSLWSVRAATCVGTLIVPLILYFSVYFPVRLQRPSLLFHVFALVPTAFFMILALTPLLVPAIEIVHGSAQPANLNILYTLQSIYFVIGMLGAFVVILRKFRHVGPRERAQIRLVITGLVIALVVNVGTGFVLTVDGQGNDYSNLAGSLSLLIFIGTTAYAIIRHRLFDLRLAIVRSLGFIFTVGLLSVVYCLLVLGLGVPLITGGRLTLARDNLQLLLLLPPTLLAALTFHSLEQFIARRTNRLFYQGLYDTRAVLDKLSDALISDNDLHKIVVGGITVIRDAIQPMHVLVVLFDQEGAAYVQAKIDRAEPKDIRALTDELRKLQVRLLAKDEVPVGHWRHDFEAEDISLVLRLGTTKKLIGVLFFGPKQNGRIYTKQDMELLSVSAKNFAIAIENAQKYQQIAAFADTMHDEVLKATASLRRANTKLRTLDALKDDFISMASHQLRSPAASVHDAIKMLGQTYLTAAERKKIIELADASSERLVNVVTDMLSVARIQAGHFDLEKTPVDMQELAERTVLQASALANEKGITFHINKPKEPIRLQADRAKLIEIMANYVENAIRYSHEKTEVAITIREADGRIYVEVRDHGIGVPQAERKHLFDKFYRATNARKEQPNGNGIGLYVVKTVAQAHGGDAYYEPQADGSLFGFWLKSEK